MTRLLFLLALAAPLGACDLIDGCPPTAFGDECAALGEWRLQTLDGDRATGRIELEDLGDVYLALPSGIEGCGEFRGAASWSMSETEGTLRIRTWRARATCDDGGLAYGLDLNGTYALDGDRLTVRWRPDRLLSDGEIPSLGDGAELVFVR